MEGDPLPGPGARRRRAADPAPQRVQDRRPDGARPRARGGPARAPARPRLRAARRRRRRPAPRAPRLRGGARRVARRDPRDPGRGAPRRRAGRRDAALARDRAAHAEGLDRPACQVDGIQVEGTNRSHQVPLAGVRENPQHLAQLERWLRSYHPEERFDAGRRARPRARRARARRRPAHGRAAARQRRTRARRRSTCPIPPRTRWRWPRRRRRAPSPRAGSGRSCATSTRATTHAANFRLFSPDETSSNRLGDVFADRGSHAARRASPATSTCRRTGASWRCCPSTTARAGWRATC